MYATENKYISEDPDTYTEITTNVSDEPTSNYAKSGAGYARIIADALNKNNYYSRLYCGIMKHFYTYTHHFLFYFTS